MNVRCDTSSSQAKANPGHAAGCSAWNAEANDARTCTVKKQNQTRNQTQKTQDLESTRNTDCDQVL